MKNYLINTKATSNVISESRNFYEVEQSLGNGSTKYGKIANIIACNSQYIDTIAECLGNYVSSVCVADKLYKQYHDDNHKVNSWIKRNVYLDNLEEKKMSNDRFIKGITINLITQLGVKYGIRGIHHLLNEKEKITIFNEIDTLLRYYTYINLDNKVCNQNMAKIELMKIEDTFPLNNKQTQKLNKISIPNSIDMLNLKTISQLDDTLKESISYLIYSIHMQKYGDNSDMDKDIMELYSLLGYGYTLSKELLRENDETYNELITDQKKFLNISRSIFQNVAMELPTIDISNIKNKAVEMATFDPYIQRRKKASKVGKGAGTTLAGLLLKEPSLVVHGCATGLSILNIDDYDKEIIRKKLLKNSFDSNTIDEILSRSQLIHNNSIDK